MCGICGLFDTKNALGDVTPVLEKMTGALSRRGPDEAGVFRGDHFAFGHRRLKVIDLETGRQPMVSEDGRVSIVFNGEIYNFKEIRDRLQKKGIVFKTRSDTESILRLYEEKGMRCLEDLEGMFAFSVHDRRERKLYLAVDRFGKKPLYYWNEGSFFLFASEVKSLLTHPRVRKNIDEASLSQYLAFEYVPAPGTIFKNIRKLESGTYVEVSEEIKVHRYFSRDFSTVRRDENEWKSLLLEHFEGSVRKRLVSDVPLGIFLSGGLDSSAVLAMAKEVSPETRFKTFTIGFDEASFDESGYAKEVSDVFGTEHITEKCSAKQMLSEHEDILSYLDEPLADASFIPTFMLCRLARRHVTVALSGDGGDELFMGYPTFLAALAAQKLENFPKPMLKGLEALVNCLPVSVKDMSFDFRLKQFLKGMFYKAPLRDQVWLGAFSDLEEKNLLTAPFKPYAEKCYEAVSCLTASSAEEYLKKLQEFYFNFYLQGDILVKVDRASMANSLEVRSPLLDDRLVTEMLKIPSDLLMKDRITKFIFKRSLEGRLPGSIIHRKKKGFGIPVARWIREDLRSEFESVLSPKKIQKDGLFESDTVESILHDHLSGKRDNRKKLWTLYVFQKWKTHWFDR